MAEPVPVAIEQGVDLRLGVQVSGIEKLGGRAVVRLADGDSVEADLVVVGIGVAPNVALAEAAGLATDNGILVDEHADAIAVMRRRSAAHDPEPLYL